VLSLVKEPAEAAVTGPDPAVHEPVQDVTSLAGPDRGAGPLHRIDGQVNAVHRGDNARIVKYPQENGRPPRPPRSAASRAAPSRKVLLPTREPEQPLAVRQEGHVVPAGRQHRHLPGADVRKLISDQVRRQPGRDVY
jgi:hypothetical protein